MSHSASPKQPVITVSVSGGLPLERAGLEALLERLPGLGVVAPDADPPPQVTIRIPDHGVQQDWSDLSPRTALLILVPNDDPLPWPVAEGASSVVGLFSQSESPETLSIAIRQMARGQAYLSSSLALALVLRQQDPAASVSPLSEREREVLALLAEGLSNKAIAARLYLSVRTVEGHLANLYSRLGLHSRTEAMRYAIHHHLTTTNR